MDIPFFEKLWMTKSQAEIYLWLYKLWSQPASIVAKQLWLERTKVYRNLLTMTKMWIIKKATKNGIQVFFVNDIQDLSRFVDRQVESLSYIENNKLRIIDEIQKTKLETANLPKISIYDNSEWVWSIFDDILSSISLQKLLTIRMFASNTHLEQNENIRAEEFAKKFFDNLNKNKIHIDMLIWSWNLIMERVDTFFDWRNIWDLPATQSSINIILVWKTLYIIIYNKTPQWIKIENENLADAMHILFDTAKKYDLLMNKS